MATPFFFHAVVMGDSSDPWRPILLDTVLVARDRWLAPGGLLFPDKASLFLVAIEDADYKREKMDFWDNVCAPPPPPLEPPLLPRAAPPPSAPPTDC